MTDEDLHKLLRYDSVEGKIYPRYKYTRNVMVDKPLGTCVRYCSIIVRRKRFYAHRLAWFLYHKRWPEYTIDHINGDKLDNRITNLRDIKKEDQRLNQPISKNNKSGVLGVSWCKEREKWRSTANYKGKHYNLGRFTTKEAAILAREEFNAGKFHKNHGREK